MLAKFEKSVTQAVHEHTRHTAVRDIAYVNPARTNSKESVTGEVTFQSITLEHNQSTTSLPEEEDNQPAMSRLQTKEDLYAISEPDTPLPRHPTTGGMCKECLDYKRRCLALGHSGMC